MATILVVDDNPVDRRVVGGLLEKAHDMTVRYAADGALALADIRSSPPDLVVTDLVMPNLDGLELVGNVVREFPRVPIVLMTGQGSEEIAVKALRAGAASYVPKSHLAGMLVETVQKLISMSREQESQLRLLGRMVRNEFEFLLESDLSLVPPLITYLTRCLRNVGYDDEGGIIRTSVALEEALNNSIYHGNLELTSDLREIEQATYRRILKERRDSLPYCARRVHVSCEVSREQALFRIRDEGPGFDPTTLPDPTDPANLERASGRGVMLMRTFMESVDYNSSGNEVTMVKKLRASVPL